MSSISLPDIRSWKKFDAERKLMTHHPGFAGEAHEWEGMVGNRQHITRREIGTMPTSAIAHLPGQSGEVRGQHRNMQGPAWEAFKADVAANGIHEPITVHVDHGKAPVISEGNHRLDAAAELGMDRVPVEVTYYGHAEQQGTVANRPGPPRVEKSISPAQSRHH